MPLAAQIVDQHVSGIIERHSDDFGVDALYFRPPDDHLRVRPLAACTATPGGFHRYSAIVETGFPCGVERCRERHGGD